jgi:hypothetical protein
VRLARYLAVEVIAGIGLVAGAVATARYGVPALLETGTARAQVAQLHEIVASRPALPRLPQAAALDPLAAPVRPPHWQTRGTYFFGLSDQALLEPLRNAALRKAKFNRGGSSVSLRVDFTSGGRASFKPDQTNLQSVPRKEVAAYRIDRMIGLSHVAPVLAGAIPRQDVVAAMEPAARALLPRFNAEVIATSDGLVTGSLAWWIPEISNCRIDGFPVDSTDGVVVWKRYLTIGHPLPAAVRPMAEQISAMVLFDLLINNFDRWSGSNVKCSPDMRRLYFMDNALSFGVDPQGQLRARLYFKRVQRFSRSLVDAVRRLDRVEITDVMNTDTGPWPSLLTEAEIDAMMKRRDHLLAYIDELIALFGEDQVLVFL